jgi:hypothetical protein
MSSSKKSKRTTESKAAGRNGAETGVHVDAAEESVQDFVNRLTDNMRWSEQLPRPTDLERLRDDLQADLEDVPVVTSDGQVTNVFEKIDSDTFLTHSDKELVWNCLAMVREMFWRLENAKSNKVPGYQWNMNWKHTRAEVDQVFDAAKLMNLSAKETRDALVASIFSDAIKSRGNFIIHNVHGAQAAAQVLSYFLDPSKSSDRKSIERVVRASKEHQIAPPEFMATVVSIMLHRKHRLGKFTPNAPAGSGTRAKDAFAIYNKIRNPFDAANVSEDLRTIAFTEGERELLSTIGIEDWYVPHPDDPGSRIGHAVIAGDHSINYNHPEGFAKIALLRGPDTESIFEDPTIHHSLESAVQSFTDSFRVIRPEVQGLALAGLRRTKTAVERVSAVMTELFNGIIVGPRDPSKSPSGYESIERALRRAQEKHPDLYTEKYAVSDAGDRFVEMTLNRVGDTMDKWYKEHGPIPFNPKALTNDEPGPGKLPFWNTSLKYPERDEDGELIMASLNDLENEQFLFADKIREITVELLRAEQWIFSVAEH